ncbi:MAG: SDR family oxidoreductase [Pseudomonadota bacterium]
MTAHSSLAIQPKPLAERNLLVIGASRGIGAAVAQHYAGRVARLASVSRGQAAAGEWIAADLARPEDIAEIAASWGETPLDGLLFMGGTWEQGAFTAEYDFAASTPEETLQVLAVNLAAPILLVQHLRAALAASSDPRIVLMGSLSGLDNAASPEVANSASKFGLRGAAQAMEKSLRPLGASVTVINPGNVGTEEVDDDIASGVFSPQVPIPMSDLLAAMDFVLNASPATTVREINLAQRHPVPRPTGEA